MDEWNAKGTKQDIRKLPQDSQAIQSWCQRTNAVKKLIKEGEIHTRPE